MTLVVVYHLNPFLPHDAFEFAIRGVDETERVLGGWIKQQEEIRNAHL